LTAAGGAAGLPAAEGSACIKEDIIVPASV
jgi:hypothetical protein